MAALTPPSIKKMVLNRIPWLVDNSTVTELINDFTVEIMSELQKVLSKTDAQYLDEDNYRPQEKSLMADMVGISLIHRRVLSNTEGEAGEAATGNKILSKAKAGEAEAEFEVASITDGNKLLLAGKDTIEKLKSDARRKARDLGFLLDISEESEFVISAYSRPALQFVNVSLYD